MRCKGCRYRLWNLAPGPCPECGRGFTPSEFRFIPNSVQFKCPNCEQDYYGTDAAGLLEPRAFTCTKCQCSIEMDAMTLTPAAGVDGDRCECGLHPWTDRKSRGLIRRFFLTCWRGCVDAEALGTEAREDPAAESAKHALRFASIAVMLPVLSSVFIFYILVALMLGFAGTVGTGVISTASMFGIVAVPLLLGMLVLIPSLLLWAACTHGILRLGGPLPLRFKRTLCVLCYASGPTVSTALPCIGPYCLSPVASIWCLVSAVIQVRAMHRVSTLRATLAVVLPTVVLAVVLFTAYMSLILLIPASWGPTQSGVQLTPPAPLVAPQSDAAAEPPITLESPPEEDSANDQLPTESVPNPR